jgi:hypothetical protein
VLAIPEVIFPGLKIPRKVAAPGIMVGMWSSTFEITAKEVSENTIELVIPVEANVIESNETNVEIQPEVITIPE